MPSAVLPLLGPRRHEPLLLLVEGVMATGDPTSPRRRRGPPHAGDAALPTPAASWVLATAWVLSAIGTATVVVQLAWVEGSAPFVFVEGLFDAAFKFSICIIFLFLALAAALLCSLCLLYLVAVVSGSGSDFKKSAFGAITWESTHKLLKLPRAVVLGLVADLAFILLSVAGFLTMLMSPSGKGSMSQGERIVSVIAELGLLGIHATFSIEL